MRVTGVGLFVLALTHFLIIHVIYDPAEQDASWIAQVRWSSLFWRAFDWSLLMLVLFHAFMGMRTVVVDYAAGGRRTLPPDRPLPRSPASCSSSARSSS